MKIGMTLLCRDEGDVIKQWLDFHIPKVDFIVVTDNGSVDGTREMLEKYSDAIHIIDEPAQDYKQDQWVNKMIKVCSSYGCEWVVNSDADEFWHTDFHKLTENVSDKVGSIAVKCRLFVPTIKDDNSIEDPIKRMKYYTPYGRNADEQRCFQVWHKVIHRTNGFKGIELGNHKAHFVDRHMQMVTAKDENYIAHYPNRSWEQFRYKIINGGEAYFRSTHPKGFGWHWRQKYDAYYRGGTTELKRLWYNEIEHKTGKLVKL